MNNGQSNAALLIVDLLTGARTFSQEKVVDAQQLLADGAGKKLMTTRKPVEVRDAAVRLHDLLAAAGAAGPTWRDYSLHQYGEADVDVAVLCRSDGGCEDFEANASDRYLTLGEAVDWAQKHVADHARRDAEIAAEGGA